MTEDHQLLRSLAVQAYQSASGLSRFIPALSANEDENIRNLRMNIAHISAEIDSELLKYIYSIEPDIKRDLGSKVETYGFFY